MTVSGKDSTDLIAVIAMIFLSLKFLCHQTLVTFSTKVSAEHGSFFVQRNGKAAGNAEISLMVSRKNYL